MCVYIYTALYLCVYILYMSLYTYIPLYICVCMYIQLCIYMYILYMSLYTYIPLYMCVYIYTPVCVSVQLLGRVQLFATPWTEAHQDSLSIINSQS